MALNINGTTGISGVDGSVSAPAVTGTDSNTGITFPSADTIKFSTGGVERMTITNSGVVGGGKILQVVTATTTSEASTSSSSFVDTNVTASITPSATSSKILVMIDAPFHIIRNPGTTNAFNIKVLRDSTEITDAITDGGTHLSGIGSGAISSNSSAGSIVKIILDSPSSTSSLTYKLQMGGAFSTNTVYFQDGSQSHITLMEVAG